MASYEARGPPVKPAAPFVSLLRRRPRDLQEHPDGLVLLVGLGTDHERGDGARFGATFWS
jgi:hypothetical protein